MANNRMYLRCRACGEDLLLAKNFDDFWWELRASEGDLAAFIQKHNDCGEDLPKGERLDHRFEIVYEE